MTNVLIPIVAGQPIHHRDTWFLHRIFMRFSYHIGKNKDDFGPMRRWWSNLLYKSLWIYPSSEVNISRPGCVPKDKRMPERERWKVDPDAFADFFHRYSAMVLKTAYLMLGNKEEAEDALQEVFLKVWQARRTFDPAKGSVPTWLYRITVNLCISKRRKRRPLVLPEESFKPVISSDSDPADEFKKGRLMLALDSLPPKQRTVVVLRYFDDLSYKEIAQAVGIPVGTVKSRLNHAIGKLRVSLGVDEKDELQMD